MGIYDIHIEIIEQKRSSIKKCRLVQILV